MVGVPPALMTKTSWSGSVYLTKLLQSWFASSNHFAPLNLTMRPTAPAGEGDVVRLVAGRDGGDELLRHHVDHAHVVGELVGHPDLVRPGPHCHAHRVDADRHVACETERSIARDVEDREPALVGVDGVETVARGRKR